MNKIKMLSLLAAAAMMTGSVAMAETYSATGNGYHGEMTVNVTIENGTITDVALGGRHGAIAASIIALGRTFGLRVVAEGVEHAAQAQFLLAHGCAQQQGYLHARPMPAEDYARRLAALQAAGGGGTAR